MHTFILSKFLPTFLLKEFLYKHILKKNFKWTVVADIKISMTLEEN